MHQRSATELRQSADKLTLQFSICTVKRYCYATVSLSTDQRKFCIFFQRFLISIEFWVTHKINRGVVLSELLLIKLNNKSFIFHSSDFDGSDFNFICTSIRKYVCTL